MLSTAQKCWIRTIHTAKTKLKLSDESYRALLQGAAQINSSKEIKTWVQYDSIMSAFQKLGFTLCKQKVDRMRSAQNFRKCGTALRKRRENNFCKR